MTVSFTSFTIHFGLMAITANRYKSLYKILIISNNIEQNKTKK